MGCSGLECLQNFKAYFILVSSFTAKPVPVDANEPPDDTSGRYVRPSVRLQEQRESRGIRFRLPRGQ